MADYYKNHRGEVSISQLMQRLRDELDAAGIEWHDASEEFGWDDYVYHMERTKVVLGGEQIASCIYGYSGQRGRETGSTYGWPDQIESWDSSNSGGDPEPRAIDDIVATVKEDWDR